MNPAAKKRGIPSAVTVFQDARQRQWATAIQELLEIVVGIRGRPEDQAVTWDKMLKLGLAVLKNDELQVEAPAAVVFQVQREAPVDWNGAFDVVDPVAGQTITVQVSNGEVTNWAGDFTAVNSVTKQTQVLTVSSGLISPTDGTFEVVDPAAMTTVTMTIADGRIKSVV